MTPSISLIIGIIVAILGAIITVWVTKKPKITIPIFSIVLVVLVCIFITIQNNNEISNSVSLSNTEQEISSNEEFNNDDQTNDFIENGGVEETDTIKPNKDENVISFVPHEEWLVDLTYFEKDDIKIWGNEPWEMNNGVEIYNFISVTTTSSDDGRYIKYYLNGKYERLTGIYGLTVGGRNTSYESYLTISVDGIKVYTSPIITAGCLPVEFDIDITGCELLELRLSKPAAVIADAKVFDEIEN